MTAPRRPTRVLVVDKPVGPTSFDVVRQVRRAARRPARRPRRDARSAGLGRAADLPGRGDQAGAVPARRRQGVRGHDPPRRRDRHRRRRRARSPPRRDAGARSTRPRVARARWRAFRGPDHAGAAGLLGAQARRAAALRLRARRRGGRGRAARRGHPRARADVASRARTAVALRVRCSKGTYVRALARDLGRALGVGAHVTALRRTRSGPFALARRAPARRGRWPRSARRACGGAARWSRLAAALAPPRQRVRRAKPSRAICALGRKRVAWDVAATAAPPERRVCLLDPRRGSLVAVAEPRPDGTVRTLRVFGFSSSLSLH